jgi:small subunit ribosomal protein S11
MFVQKKEIYNLTITFTSNNIFFNISNKENNSIIVYSAGIAGFGRLKKKNRIIIQSLLSKIIRKIKQIKIYFFNVHLKNVNKHSRNLLKCLLKTDLSFNIIRDLTPISHNGCRLRKKKRR